jgi:hypothetical protein
MPLRAAFLCFVWVANRIDASLTREPHGLIHSYPRSALITEAKDAAISHYRLSLDDCRCGRAKEETQLC